MSVSPMVPSLATNERMLIRNPLGCGGDGLADGLPLLVYDVMDTISQNFTVGRKEDNITESGCLMPLRP
jgi:hypothetical protein